MTLEYIDGFGDYSTAQMSRYITAQWVNGGVTTFDGNLTINASGGRNGRGALTTSNANYGASWTLTTQATWTLGFAYKVGSLPGVNTGICMFSDAGTIQLSLRVNSDGTLSVLRGSPVATVLATSTQSISAGVWYHIQFQGTIHNTTGAYTLRVNSTDWLTASSQNTRVSANNSANQVGLGGYATSAIVVSYSDFFAESSTTFHGDCLVETKFATGAGTTTNFTPSAGSNYQNVDEATPDDDTTYNSSVTTGHIDLYTYPALTTGAGAVKAVVTVPVLRNDAAGTVTVQSVYRSGAVNYFGASNNIGSTTYAPYKDIAAVDPNTSAAWTIAAVNSCEFGLKVVA